MKSHDFSGLPAGFSRRHFLGASLGAMTALALGGLSRPAGAASPIVLPPLPYADSALAPVISANTIGYHYGKHHKAYVDNLNKFIAGTDLADLSLDKIVLATAGKADKTAIFNNAAQTWNHTFYWNSLRANGGGEPPAALKHKIEAAFGSVDTLKKELAAAAMGQFGSEGTELTGEVEDLEARRTFTPGFTLDPSKMPRASAPTREANRRPQRPQRPGVHRPRTSTAA